MCFLLQKPKLKTYYVVVFMVSKKVFAVKEKKYNLKFQSRFRLFDQTLR